MRILKPMSNVNRIEDAGRFHADVQIKCTDCGKPMVVFLGLPRGLDLDGATISFEGTEARLAIHPQDEVLTETPAGFMIREIKPP